MSGEVVPPLPSVPSTVTVIKDAAGRYFASFVVETDPETLPARGRSVGIDLGLTHFAILSDGTKIDIPALPAPGREEAEEGTAASSPQGQGSNNRAKARIKVARAHARVADARREFHHQLSTQLIRENQAIAVEDLAVGIVEGALLGEVRKGTAAAAAGLHRTRQSSAGRIVPGDVIQEIDGKPVRSVSDLLGHLGNYKPGDTVTLTVWRDGSSRKVRVQLQAPQ